MAGSLRPEAENDVIEIAAWYNSRSESLGGRFIEEFLAVLDELTINPLLHCRRHPHKNIRWRYEVLEREKTVVVAAVLHAARHDREWKRRV